MSKKLAFHVVILMLAALSISSAQTLKNLVNQPPDGAIVGFLLTDGTVMYQGNGESDWWRLTPDKSGSYVNCLRPGRWPPDY